METRQIVWKAPQIQEDESMTKKEAWDLIKEHCELPYEAAEEEEMAEYIDEFEIAYDIVDREMRS